MRQTYKNNGRKSQFHNFESSKHINILFDSRSEAKFRKIKGFINELEDRGKAVSALGIVEKDENVGSFLYKKGVNFFSPKDVNWFGKPDSEAVRSFTAGNPDIFINFCLDNHFPVRFITAASQADFIISAQKNDPYADFIIDISENKEISFFIEQIKHYLQIIKRAKAQ